MMACQTLSSMLSAEIPDSDRMILPELEIVNGKLQITLVRLKTILTIKSPSNPKL